MFCRAQFSYRLVNFVLTASESRPEARRTRGELLRPDAAALADRIVAEFQAGGIHGALDGSTAGCPVIEQIGRVAGIGRTNLAQPDAEQAKAGAVCFASKQRPPYPEDDVGKLCWVLQAHAAGLDPEGRGLELQRHGTAAQSGRLGAGGDALGLIPEDAFQLGKARDVRLERRLGRHAFAFAVGFDGARILAEREAVEPASGIAIAGGELRLAGRLQLADAGDAVLVETRL